MIGIFPEELTFESNTTLNSFILVYGGRFEYSWINSEIKRTKIKVVLLLLDGRLNITRVLTTLPYVTHQFLYSLHSLITVSTIIECTYCTQCIRDSCNGRAPNIRLLQNVLNTDWIIIFHFHGIKKSVASQRLGMPRAIGIPTPSIEEKVNSAFQMENFSTCTTTTSIDVELNQANDKY